MSILINFSVNNVSLTIKVEIYIKLLCNTINSAVTKDTFF